MVFLQSLLHCANYGTTIVERKKNVDPKSLKQLRATNRSRIFCHFFFIVYGVTSKLYSLDIARVSQAKIEKSKILMKWPTPTSVCWFQYQSSNNIPLSVTTGPALHLAIRSWAWPPKSAMILFLTCFQANGTTSIGTYFHCSPKN